MIVGGGSVGRNLATQLLYYHLSHLVLGIQPVSLNARRFAGVFLVSASSSGRTDTISFRDNERVAMLTAAIVKNSEAHVLRPHDRQGRPYEVNPALSLDGGLCWFCCIQSVTESLHIACGKQGIFRGRLWRFCRL